MKQSIEKSKLTSNSLVWLITTILAIIAGGVGGYFSFSFFMTPGLLSLNEISPDLMNRTRPIIQEAKNVVVQQNDQIQNVANKLSDNLLAINIKIDKTTIGWQKNYYDTSLRVAEAIPLTSDGWLTTNFNQLNDNGGKNANNFVIISKEGAIYEIERVVKDNFTNITFVKISSRSLPVSKFADSPIGKNGNLLVAASFDGTVNNFYQINSLIGTTSAVKFSDARNEEIKLNQRPGNYLVLSNLAGEIEAFISPSGIFSSRTINKDFDSLLKFQQIKRPMLGFFYLDQNILAPVLNTTNNSKQLVLYSDATHVWPKNSPALVSGLKNNDIILAVDGKDLSPGNSDNLLNVLPGDNIKLTVKRLEQNLTVDLKVGELK